MMDKEFNHINRAVKIFLKKHGKLKEAREIVYRAHDMSFNRFLTLVRPETIVTYIRESAAKRGEWDEADKLWAKYVKYWRTKKYNYRRHADKKTN